MARNARDIQRDLENWRIKETDSFSKKVTKASKLASVNLQRKINGRIDRPTNFTQQAVGFSFKIDRIGSVNRIYIKDAQARYLAPLIDSDKEVSKFVPLQGYTNNFGNIAGLKNMKNLKKITQKRNGVTRTVLIKTTAKKQNKRLIAIFKKARRIHRVGTWSELSVQMIQQVNRVVMQ